MASRGKGKRRREALALRSSRDLLKRGKSGMAKQLPPPPKAQDGEQLVPRSLKRMMALCQGQAPAGGSQAASTGGVPGKQRGNKFKMAAAEGTHSANGANAAAQEPLARADASGAQPAGEEPAPGSGQPGARSSGGGADSIGRRADGSKSASVSTAAGAGGSGGDHLSGRQRARREHFKAKQQKKKAKRQGGNALAGSDDEDALERRLMSDRNAPKFGEQAMAPLKTSLKRKHWDGDANARHSALFERQMLQATARLQPNAAMRDQVIEAYRQQKRAASSRKGGAPPAATRASLVALTRSMRPP